MTFTEGLPGAPPLLEAIFELRWGESKPGQFKFENSDKDLFSMRLGTEAYVEGFKELESLNSDAPSIPHLMRHRFRKEPNTWPCIQAGLGIVTVNQIADGYGWVNFNQAIQTLLSIFTRVDDDRLSRISESAKLRLIYQDFFPYEEKVNINKFLEDKLSIKVEFPKEFLDSDNLERLDELSLALGHEIVDPRGKMSVRIVQAINDGQPGYLVETIVESSFLDAEISTTEHISCWVNKAHDLQKHSYQTLMK